MRTQTTVHLNKSIFTVAKSCLYVIFYVIEVLSIKKRDRVERGVWLLEVCGEGDARKKRRETRKV